MRKSPKDAQLEITLSIPLTVNRANSSTDESELEQGQGSLRPPALIFFSKITELNMDYEIQLKCNYCDTELNELTINTTCEVNLIWNKDDNQYGSFWQLLHG